MVKNLSRLNQFYKRLTAKEKIPYRKALSVYEALRREAVSLGILSSRNIWDGIESDLRLAKTLNQLP